jgi:hypothetical protein
VAARRRRAPARTGRRPAAARASAPPAAVPASPTGRAAPSESARPAQPAARLLPLATLAATFACALVLYCLTLAPTVTFEDSGELISAAFSLGVPHEPGYPLWTLIAHVFTWLPLGNVALRCNLMSAVCSAVAAALVAWATMLSVDQCRSAAASRDGHRARSGTGRSAHDRAADAHLTTASPWWPAAGGADALLSCAAGLAAGVLAATAATTWSQAIITEVYGLNAALVGLLLVLTLVWGRAATPRLRGRLFLAVCLVMGLGLTAHDTFIVFLPVLALYGLVIERRLRPSWPRLAAGAGMYCLGLAPYLYLPLAAARSPLMDWGDPRSWTTFWRVVTRRQYVTGGHTGPRATLAELGTSVSLLVHQWLPVLLVLAAAGLLVLFLQRRSLFWLAVALVVATWPAVTIITDFPTNTATASLNADDRALVSVFYIPSYLVLALLTGLGAWWLAGRALAWRAADRQAGPSPVSVGLLAVVLAALPVGLGAARAPGLTMHRYRFADAYIHNVLALAAPHSLIMVDRDQFGFPLDYAQDVEGLRPDVVVLDQELLRRSWYLHDLARRYPALIAGSRAQVQAFLSALAPFEAGRPYDGAAIDAAYYAMIASFVRRYENAGHAVYFTYGPDQRVVAGSYGEPLAVVLEARRTGPGKGAAALLRWLTPVDLARCDFAHLTDGTVPLDRNALMVRTWYGEVLYERAQLLAQAGRTAQADTLLALARRFGVNGGT